jgi:hypothetical protein
MPQKLKEPPARRRQTPRKSVFVPKTELAAQLWAIRQKFIADGGKLLGPDDIRKEVARRRGEEP